MRAVIPAILALSLASVACTRTSPAPPIPAPPSAELRESAGSPTGENGSPPVSVPAASLSPAQPLRLTRTTLSGIGFEGVAFDSRNLRLTVVDQPGGPGSTFPDAKSAGKSRNALAAFNAGFFTPEGLPLGKVVAAGKEAGAWNRSSLGAGVFAEDSSGKMTITRRKAASASGKKELLQAGPLLVEGNEPVGGLDSAKTAVRTLIAWDGGNRWWIGRASACSLSQLGAALASGSPAPWKVRTALNLDGGRSTDIWISGSVPGGPADFRPFWNRPVRNFLVLTRR